MSYIEEIKKVELERLFLIAHYNFHSRIMIFDTFKSSLSFFSPNHLFILTIYILESLWIESESSSRNIISGHFESMYHNDFLQLIRYLRSKYPSKSSIKCFSNIFLSLIGTVGEKTNKLHIGFNAKTKSLKMVSTLSSTSDSLALCSCQCSV